MRNNKGFSLTEIMTAISIIGMVATLAGNKIDNALSLARDAHRKANIEQLQTALGFYYDDHGSYPVATDGQTENGWGILKNSLESDDIRTYCPNVPNDPLDSGGYKYGYWSNGQEFKIIYETEDADDASPQIAWGM
jgi:prepilin-type N-terminal cleavage/methylation domain-containing protein